jgi:hypothetical protein
MNQLILSLFILLYVYVCEIKTVQHINSQYQYQLDSYICKKVKNIKFYSQNNQHCPKHVDLDVNWKRNDYEICDLDQFKLIQAINKDKIESLTKPQKKQQQQQLKGNTFVDKDKSYWVLTYFINTKKKNIFYLSLF